MFFNGKSIRQITEDDLLALIGTSREGKTIDFKTTAYNPIADIELENKGQSERDKLRNKWKLDLRNDLTAFANSGGGWIICGMKEEAGVATELLGLGSDFNGDATIRRLTDCSRTGIEPPIDINGIVFHEVDLKDDHKSKALVIQILRSYRFPHRVSETSKFNVRRERGNAEMNVDELREAFNLSANLTDRIKEFRVKRVEALQQRNTEEIPLYLNPGIKAVLHCIPISFIDPTTTLSFNSFEFINKGFEKSGHWHLAKNARHNLHGVVIPIDQSKNVDPVDEYIQVFRTGAVEAVFTPKVTDSRLRLDLVESYTLEHLEYSLGFLKALGVFPPIAVMLSLIDTKGVQLSVHLTALGMRTEVSLPLTQSRLLLPDVVFNSYEEAFDSVIKPIFDVLWNTGGWRGSMNYDPKTGKRYPFDR